MRYGFIGLGHLGGKLASSLLRHRFDLVIHDIDRAKAKPLLLQGAKWAESSEEVASKVGAIITCLPSPAVSEHVLTAPDGVLVGARPGATWIEMSSNDPETMKRLSKTAWEHGVTTLEAPVSGGPHLAETGEVTIIVGGDAEALSKHRRVFAAMSKSLFPVGPIGSASAMTAITNMLALTHVVAIGEALMLAKRAGIDLAAAFHVIRASSGNSFVHETESQVILNGSYNIGRTLDLACDDLGFATQLGRDLGVPLELATLTARTFARAREAHGGDAWSSKVVKLLEDALKTDLRAPGFPAEL
jgi:3-hydroxyisobutyrate dehydrogenase